MLLTILGIYFVGVIIAWFIVGSVNDIDDEDIHKISFANIFLSWIILLFAIIILLIELPPPSVKKTKEFWKNNFNKKDINQ